MWYLSTRNEKIKKSPAEAVLQGIADDGGLYMLKDFSALDFDYKNVLNLSTMETAEVVLSALLDDFCSVKGYYQPVVIAFTAHRPVELQ